MSPRKTDSPIALHPHRFTTEDNIHIVADIGGAESGLPILLLHGGGQTRHSWKKLAHTLVRKGCRVANVDLRGHGDSDWSSTGNYGVDAFTKDIRMLIEFLPSPPVLVGASLGGMISLLTIGESDRPLARGLVLVDIVPKIEPEGSAAIFRFMKANPEGFASLEEAAAAVSAYLPHRPRPPSNAGLMKNLRPRKNGRLYWHWDPRFLEDHMDTEDLSARMDEAARNIRVPTLLVRGAKSDLVSMEGVRHFLGLIPDAGFVDIKDAAHMVAGDMNDVFNQAIIDFIEQQIPPLPHSHSP